MLRNHDELEAHMSAHLWHLGAVGRSSKKGGVPWNISVVASEVVLPKTAGGLSWQPQSPSGLRIVRLTTNVVRTCMSGSGHFFFCAASP